MLFSDFFSHHYGESVVIASLAVLVCIFLKGMTLTGFHVYWPLLKPSFTKLLFKVLVYSSVTYLPPFNWLVLIDASVLVKFPAFSFIFVGIFIKSTLRSLPAISNMWITADLSLLWFSMNLVILFIVFSNFILIIATVCFFKKLQVILAFSRDD